MKRVTILFSTTLAIACAGTSDNEDSGADGDGGGMTMPGIDGGSTMDDTGGSPPGCADPNDPNAPRVEVSANIDGGAEWTCDTIYVLTSIVFVHGGELAIEPGTTILGTNGSALVIDSDATIEAAGTPDAPIVFTSALPEGERNRGDWGGLVLIGNAVTNVGSALAEGFADPPTYGGDDDTHDCGTLQYVRVEWAGFAISDGNELNAITFYACGSGTTVDHVQAHMGLDDGFEMFGGTFGAKYIVSTGNADDSIDIDQGFRGTLQHVFIQQDPAIGNNCYEVSNQGDVFDAEPTSRPIIANSTCIGSGAGGDQSIGLTLKEGTAAEIYSSIFDDVTNEAIRLTQRETQGSAEAGDVVLRGNIFGDSAGFVVGDEDGETWMAADLEALVTDDGANQVADPELASTEWGAVDPTPGAIAADAGMTPSEAFLDATAHAGAVEPGGTNWTAESWIDLGT